MKFDPERGEEVWHYQSSKGGFTLSEIFVEDGVVYSGARTSGEFVALDAQTGALRWATDVQTVWASMDPGPQGRIYINSGRRIHALDKATGEILWTANPGEGNWSGSLVHYDGYVYQSYYGRMVVVRASDGEIVLSEPAALGGSVWSVAAGDERVYMLTDGGLTAFRALEPGEL